MAVAVSLPPSFPNNDAPHEHLISTQTGGVGSSANALHGQSSTSPPPSPSTSGSSFVPSFPYSVALPYIPNSNANLTGYFAGSSNQPLPDDSDVQTRLPSICVDYLSHDWVESEIWASWRAMTKHKADMANGVRLENASWRTWAKQRNKLRTISPETLNWLKDSDVTWLYGPLHTSVDPVPPAKAATMEDRLNLDPQTQARHAARPIIPINAHDKGETTVKATNRTLQPTKPILKYRSLSDILSVPTHRHIANFAYDDGEGGIETNSDDAGTPKPGAATARPEAVASRGATRRTPTPVAVVEKADRRDSPALVGPTTPSDRSASADELEAPRKHISFNHFVEQCIAVDSDDDPSFYGSGSSATSDEEDEEEEDEALSFRSSPRSGTFPLGKTQPLHFDREKEPHTIAKLAPTVLKSSELVYPSPSPAVVFNGQVISSNTPFAAHIGGGVQWELGEQNLPSPVMPGTNISKWDDDEDGGGAGLDYFDGSADLGVGDEYTGTVPHHYPARKSASRTPSDQSPASSSGPSSPNLAAAEVPKTATARSILKSRLPGPYQAESIATNGEGPGPLILQTTSPTYASYADAARGQTTSPVQRGRSISRGSSSSSLDRSASADGRRSSPQIGPGDLERGRSSRRNNSSQSSLNTLGTSPSSNASDATLSARARIDVDSEASSTGMNVETSGPPSSASSSASLHSRDGTNSPSHPPTVDGKPTDRTNIQIKAIDFAQDDGHDLDKDGAFLFDSPHMPSSPTSSSVSLPRNNSFSTALQSVRWSDDEPSAARRALLRAQSRDGAASGVGRRSTHGTELVDDFGLNFVNFSDDEESGSIVGRAVEIVGTARDLVGALWTVAFRRSCIASVEGIQRVLIQSGEEGGKAALAHWPVQRSAFSMAIAPIQGMIRRRFIRDLSISVGVGFFFANVWWCAQTPIFRQQRTQPDAQRHIRGYYLITCPVAHREEFYDKYRRSHPEIFG